MCIRDSPRVALLPSVAFSTKLYTPPFGEITVLGLVTSTEGLLDLAKELTITSNRTGSLANAF